MIRLVTVKDAKKDDTFEKVGVFRYKLFCEVRKWKTGLDIYKTGISDPNDKGGCFFAEKDEFDSFNETVYFISYNSSQIINGIARFQSTEHPYMLQKDFFKTLPGFLKEDLPVSPTVWEASRTGFDPYVNKQEQANVLGNIVSSYFEFGIKNNIDFVIGNMCKVFIYILFGRSGCTIGNKGDDVLYMGNPVDIHDPLSLSVDKSVVAAKLRISKEAYQRVMATRKTSENLLYTLSGDKPFPGVQVLPEIPCAKEHIVNLKNSNMR